MLACTVTPRRMRYMGKDSLWKIRSIGKVFTLLGGFPVTRGSADLEALKRCVAVLDAGEIVVRHNQAEDDDEGGQDGDKEPAVLVRLAPCVPPVKRHRCGNEFDESEGIGESDDPGQPPNQWVGFGLTRG